ncbi:MAG: hypothetical protein HC809_08690 [Gammaproteobacteria bacterium]|nr:hypothetical protein [Gammaproteobacteria bacterium]
MNAFTQLRSLSVGDVVTVPSGVPHALQHGVRVIEFQTPVYERKILSFAQRVLTQPHWDTREAAAKMSLDLPADPSFEVLVARDGVRAERIALFPDFSVERVQLTPGARYALQTTPHCLATTVMGAVEIQSSRIAAGQACLVPGTLHGTILRNSGAAAAVALIARPNP